MNLFVDRAIIELRSGKGGDGAIAFIHEKNRPLGGPSGGNGGRGGSIYLRCSQTVTTLVNCYARRKKSTISRNFY